MPGKEFPGQKGFPTPDDTPLDEGYLLFTFPNSNDWAGLLLGAADALSHEWNFYNWGEMLPDEAADAWRQIINQAPYNLREPNVPAPYWEDGDEADDEAPIETQQWYGYVSEGNFIEDAGVWLISNFLASALSPTVATLYATHQRKVRLAFLEGGPGKVVTVYVNDIVVAVQELQAEGNAVKTIDVITGYVDTAVEVMTTIEEIA